MGGGLLSYDTLVLAASGAAVSISPLLWHCYSHVAVFSLFFLCYISYDTLVLAWGCCEYFPFLSLLLLMLNTSIV